MWLSFAKADPDRFTGAVIIEADDIIEATIKTHLQGINPGGQVLSSVIPKEIEHILPTEMINKLMNKKEARALTKMIDDYMECKE